MQEAPHPSLEVIESQKGGTPRRIIEGDPVVDYSQPEIRQALKAAYRILLEYRVRRLAEQQEV
jgi:hypothetical protein